MVNVGVAVISGGKMAAITAQLQAEVRKDALRPQKLIQFVKGEVMGGQSVADYLEECWGGRIEFGNMIENGESANKFEVGEPGHKLGVK
jgi:hypothetical protein